MLNLSQSLTLECFCQEKAKYYVISSQPPSNNYQTAAMAQSAKCKIFQAFVPDTMSYHMLGWLPYIFTYRMTMHMVYCIVPKTRTCLNKCTPDFRMTEWMTECQYLLLQATTVVNLKEKQIINSCIQDKDLLCLWHLWTKNPDYSVC